ncbi:hypothetical protein COHA_009189 [Chlorella ohadii]|uniref:Uncharacterized protein n=1 Tax=Chlorella ohadii TaxID=2649997 RepID=A0AAD5DJZ4_9CHLO|nr:hypothetical protein COHA_009189 [Chlorella ohadii]
MGIQVFETCHAALLPGQGGPPPPPASNLASSPPPPDSAIVIGDPHVRGFDDQWFFFDGQPGETVSLLSTGDGAKLDATLGAGGLRGQATFVRAIAFQQGGANVVAAVYEQGGQWRMAVWANGQPMAATDTAILPGGISVEASAAPPLLERIAYSTSPLHTAPKFRDSGRPIVTITTPSMRIEAKQRKPTKPAQIADPLYGEWFDVFVTVLHPLALPVTGILGDTYGQDQVQAASLTPVQQLPTAALVAE